MNKTYPVKKGEIIELEIQQSAFKGKGLGKIDGYSIFVPNTAPGDIVETRIIKRKSGFAEGKLLGIVKPSDSRITPKCSHATVCGGCNWQHLPYSLQVDFKKQHVADHIHRIGKFPDTPILDTISSSSEFYYRNKMEFSFGDKRWLTDEEIKSDVYIEQDGYYAGMHAPGRFDRILPLSECHLIDPISFRILDFTRNFAQEYGLEAFNPVHHTGFIRNLMIRKSYYHDDLMVNLVSNGENESFMKQWSHLIIEKYPQVTTITQNVNDTKSPISVGRYEHILFGSGFIKDQIGPYIFEIRPNTFFQTNTKQAEKLYEIALEYAEIQKDDLVYDLYSGVGTLTLFLSSKASKVIGIELNPTSIENAKKNALDNSTSNVEFEVGDMKDTFNDQIIQKYGNPDVIVVDPPRAGLHPNVIEQFKALKTKKIVYVSCNSSTLARDLDLLRDLYSVEMVQPVDMFPQTYHIECVAKLNLID